MNLTLFPDPFPERPVQRSALIFRPRDFSFPAVKINLTPLFRDC